MDEFSSTSRLANQSADASSDIPSFVFGGSSNLGRPVVRGFGGFRGKIVQKPTKGHDHTSSRDHHVPNRYHPKEYFRNHQRHRPCW
jgi:hypothetical protein